MSVMDRVWNAVTAIGRLEIKTGSLSEAVKRQQEHIEQLRERIIRLEVQQELMQQLIIAAQTRPQAERATSVPTLSHDTMHP